ncbi:MAG: hypothetical protein CMJ39_07365 [Phycisphaerae bacterium]|nr:hypothetical protein [Phycisphaerae bacterium]|tara:strand:- start:15 stop:1109 length:1095 start_codon:yes stop_codon:yes gene_type:complete
MPSSFIHLLSSGLLALLMCQVGLAAERQVPEQFETIQAAINAASGGDVITLAAGRYNESFDLQGKAIVVKSRGDGLVIIDGVELGKSLIRCTSGEGPGTRLENLILIAGNGDGEVYGSDSTIAGGLLLLGSSPTVVGCTFDGNVVKYNGGAVFARNSNSQFSRCTFLKNTAEKGGAVFATASNLSLTDCEFKQNNAAFGGGAIFSDNRSSTRLDRCRMIENRASFNGGGIYDYDSATTVTNTVFLNNIGAYKGGAAYHGWRSRGLLDDTNEFRTPNDDIAGVARSMNEANPLGACWADSDCILATQKACVEGGGVWAGANTRCEKADGERLAGQRAKGDLNKDGQVDVRDMAMLLSSWGRREAN